MENRLIQIPRIKPGSYFLHFIAPSRHNNHNPRTFIFCAFLHVKQENYPRYIMVPPGRESNTKPSGSQVRGSSLGGSFFSSPGYLFDGIVVIRALALESFLEQKGGALILVVSLWQVLRVVESALELSDEVIEAHIEDAICRIEVLKEENTRLVETVAEMDEWIQNLYEELNQRNTSKQKERRFTN